MMPLTLKDHKSRDYVISLFHDYLLREHRSDLVRLSTAPAHLHLAVVVHFNCLCEFDSVFSELLLVRPQDTLALLDDGLRRALDADRFTNKSDDSKKLFHHVHVRLTALPVIPEVHRNTIPWSADVGKFIALRATVSRVGPVQVFEDSAHYVCVKCGFKFVVRAKFENHYTLRPPRFCPNRDQGCRSMAMKVCPNGSFQAKNYQEIRVHERFRCLSIGLMPRSISVCLEDDLLESVKPGDDVVINGIVTRRWQSPREGFSCEIVLAIKANYIENLSELKTGVSSNRLPTERIVEFEAFWSARSTTFGAALEARNDLVRSICPDVCGMYLIKLSLALMLAGAPEWSIASTEPEALGSGEMKSRIRGNPHILLIGDPGTAKSVLLRAATDLATRAVLTTATGTTAAGLTATAVRDAQGWTLDAGALVLADGGLCAIDEFTALHGTHRAAVHEAMEQQTISLAKAGLMARLNCRCSVLAAANPPATTHTTSSRVRDEPRVDDQGDFGLPTPLLSRFDLIWRLVDPVDSAQWDRKIANFVLKLDGTTGNARGQCVSWSADRLREYFTWIHHEFRPRLSPHAANLLQRYYVWRRRHLTVNSAAHQSTLYGRSTLRLLESLVRLTKAHARLMARREAGVEDAIIVIALMDASLQSTTCSSVTVPSIIGPYCTTMNTPEAVVACDIPDDAGLEYRRWARAIHQSLAEVPSDGFPSNLTVVVDDNEQSSPESLGHTSPRCLLGSSSLVPVKVPPSDPMGSPAHAIPPESSPILSAFSLSSRIGPADLDLTMPHVPLLTSTQFDLGFDLDKENSPDELVSEEPAEWSQVQRIPTNRPIITWPEPVPKYPLGSAKRPLQAFEGKPQQPTRQQPQHMDADTRPQDLNEPKTDWRSRISAKLARFSAPFPDSLEPRDVIGYNGGAKSTGSENDAARTTAVHGTLDFGSSILTHVHLTNEDFEIDL